MNYSNALAGGNAVPAWQGVDWSSLGPWALSQQGKQSPDIYSVLSALAGGASGPPTGGQAPTGLLGGAVRRPQLGQVNGQPAGYIGPGLSIGTRPVGAAARRAMRGQGYFGN